MVSFTSYGSQQALFEEMTLELSPDDKKEMATLRFEKGREELGLVFGHMKLVVCQLDAELAGRHMLLGAQERGQTDR